MNRKEFIKTCSFSCLSLLGLAPVLESCAPTRLIQTNTQNGRITLAKSEFNKDESGRKLRKHLLVKIANLDYPIALFRHSNTEFTATLMQCSHQNMELNLSGNILTCPAHGSEFTNRGEVLQGPAEHNLKQYAVSSDNNNIYIQLT